VRALWKLTWLELKIFAREPLGLIGALVVPAVAVVGLGRAFRGAAGVAPSLGAFVAVDLPVLAAIMIAVNTVLSLITIISIYREGGILKRLRATPLGPTRILTAHVVVKVVMTIATLVVTIAAGRRVIAVSFDWRLLSFAAALLVSMLSIMTVGFVIASVVPTARFAQPVGGLVLYPMLFLSGLFYPIEALPPALRAVARALPMTYAVSLLRGIWTGEPWLPHVVDVGALAIFAALFTALAARLFRWE